VRSARQLYRVLIVVGNLLTVIGSLAIVGCLLSAIGYGIEEYLDK